MRRGLIENNRQNLPQMTLCLRRYLEPNVVQKTPHWSRTCTPSCPSGTFLRRQLNCTPSTFLESPGVPHDLDPTRRRPNRN